MTNIPEITDSHCHLDFPDFEGYVDQVVTNATQAGVTRMVTICTSLQRETHIRSIAEHYGSVFYAVGNHPLNVAKEPIATTQELIALSGHPKMIGIGETGLDYHYTAETAKLQQESFRIHIAAARETGLPLIVHSRAADEDMSKILVDEYEIGAFSAVMHCFSSSAELARTSLELGFFLSMSGIITFPKSHELREIFSQAPIEQIIVETDAPFLAPPPHRGKRNEPAYATFTAQVGAEIFDLDYDTFAAHTQANFNRLFFKATQQ